MSHTIYSANLQHPDVRGVSKRLWIPQYRHQKGSRKRKKLPGDRWFSWKALKSNKKSTIKAAKPQNQVEKAMKVVKVPIELNKLQIVKVKQFLGLQRLSYNVLVKAFHIKESSNSTSKPEYLQQDKLVETMIKLKKQSNDLRESMSNPSKQVTLFPNETFYSHLVRQVFILKGIPLKGIANWQQSQIDIASDFRSIHGVEDPLLEYIAYSSPSSKLVPKQKFNDTNKVVPKQKSNDTNKVVRKLDEWKTEQIQKHSFFAKYGANHPFLKIFDISAVNVEEADADAIPFNITSPAIRDFIKAEKQIWKNRMIKKGTGKRCQLHFRKKQNFETLKIEWGWFGKTDRTWNMFLQRYLFTTESDKPDYKFGSIKQMDSFPRYLGESTIALSPSATDENSIHRIRNDSAIQYNRRLGKMTFLWNYEQAVDPVVPEEDGRREVVSLDPGIFSFQSYYSESECGTIGQGAWNSSILPLCKAIDTMTSKIAMLDTFDKQSVLTKSFIGKLAKFDIISSDWQKENHFLTIEDFRKQIRSNPKLKKHLRALLYDNNPKLSKTLRCAFSEPGCLKSLEH